MFITNVFALLIVFTLLAALVVIIHSFNKLDSYEALLDEQDAIIDEQNKKIDRLQKHLGWETFPIPAPLD